MIKSSNIARQFILLFFLGFTGCSGLLFVDQAANDGAKDCDPACITGKVCSNGVCISDACAADNPIGSCAPGYSCISGACKTTSTAPTCDVASPSTCGVCDPGQLCESGVCTATTVADLCTTGNTSGKCCGSEVCIAGTCGTPVCGNNVVEPGEACDGAVPATTDCTAFINTKTNTPYETGSLKCIAKGKTNECQLDTTGCATCGDGVVNGAAGERCEDGVPHGRTCESYGFAPETVTCNTQTCKIDTSTCKSCGNGTLEPGEDCDGTNLNRKRCSDVPNPSGSPFLSGTLGCHGLSSGTNACTFDIIKCSPSACGNGAIEAPEVCDKTAFGTATCQSQISVGFDAGYLTCATDCSSVDTSNCTKCGDAKIEGTEECDGTTLALLDNKTCGDLNMQGGTLGCSTTTCKFDTTQCGIKIIEISVGTVFGSPITAATLDVPTGGSAQQQFNARVVYNDDSTGAITPALLRWRMALNPGGVASIDQTGLLTAQNVTGTMLVTFVASYGGLSQSVTLTLTEQTGIICGDGVLDSSGEVCDTDSLNGSASPKLGGKICTDLPGYTGENPPGLGCLPGCQGFDVSNCTTTEICGNGTIADPEQCDGTNLGGASCTDFGLTGTGLACYALADTKPCTYDTSACGGVPVCGNGTIDTATSEQCDCGSATTCTPAELGNATCSSLGLSGSGLDCTPGCAFDTSSCTSACAGNLQQIDLVYSCSLVDACSGVVAGGPVAVSLGSNPIGMTLTAWGTYDCAPSTLVDITSIPGSLWTLTDGDGDPYNINLGAFSPATGDLVFGGASGTITATITLGTGTNEVTASIDVNVTVKPVIIPPGDPTDPVIPPNPLSFFIDTNKIDICSTTAPVGPNCCNGVTCGTPNNMPFIIYPHDGVTLPRNIYQILFQWNRGFDDSNPQSFDLYRARFDNDATNTHISVITTKDRWEPSSLDWDYVTLSNAGGHVDFSVEAVDCLLPACDPASDANLTVYTVQNKVRINLSAADVPGAIYYWSTSVRGIKKASITNNNPINFYFPQSGIDPVTNIGSKFESFQSPVYQTDSNMKCVACHAVSRDGNQLALSYDHTSTGKVFNNVDLSGQVAADNAGATAISPDHIRELGHIISPAQNVANYEFPTFNDTGKLIVGGKGSLTLIDSQTGVVLGIDPLPTGSHNGNNSVVHADFSPDGRWLAYAYAGKSGDSGIAVMSYDKKDTQGTLSLPAVNSGEDRWGTPVLLVDGAVPPTEGSWYYPAFSPDSLWLVINRSPAGLKGKDEPDSSLYALKWAECSTPSEPECRPIPICDADPVTALRDCVPIALNNLNMKYNNCDRGGPWGDPTDGCGCFRQQTDLLCQGTPSIQKWQNNMPRWAPTNRTDVYFIIFSSQRPYGKQIQFAQCDKKGDPTGTCAGGGTCVVCDQLWVAGFNPNPLGGGDPSSAPFWLPFQLNTQANHRGYWSHDPGGTTSQCAAGAGCCVAEDCTDNIDNNCNGLINEPPCCYPSTEVCDNVDNDCDTLIDEGGVCCVPEICGNGIDDDCNGIVDDPLLCMPTVTPDEICNYIDDNGNGLVDAADYLHVDFVGNTPAQGCTQAQIDTCDDSAAFGCTPNNTCPCCSTEICDGIDNDCDGLVDEVDPGIVLPQGQTCCFPGLYDGPGNPGGVCTTPDGSVTNNCLCDGLDNNCDGQVDEGCPICTPEICDGIDNDCDGLIDEADPDIGAGGCCVDLDGDGYTNCAGDCCDSGFEPSMGCSEAKASAINPGVFENVSGCQNPSLDSKCDDGIDNNCAPNNVGPDCSCNSGG